MSLTGTAFFYFLIVATIAAVAVTMFAWGAVRGPKYLRWLLRMTMIGVCQFTAIAVVAVWINNANGLYTSWDDLLGTQNGANVTLPSADTAGSQPVAFGAGPSGFRRTVYHGPVSGLSGEVLVWTPPQYDQTRYRTDSFPVIMLLHGVPGAPETWLAGGKMPQTWPR